MDRGQARHEGTGRRSRRPKPGDLRQGEDVSTLAGVTLPDHWVLKPNHRSSLVHFGGGRPDIDHLQSLTVGWMDETQSKVLGEMAYSQAVRSSWWRSIFNRGTLYEYKFFVMNGTAVIVQVDVDRFGDHRRNVYTPEWEPFDTRFQWPMGDDVPPPPKLAEMVSAAEHIAGDLDFLRVDLYYIGAVIYFGEVAAYPGSGLVRHHPYSSNVRLGDLWDLPVLSPQDPSVAQLSG